MSVGDLTEKVELARHQWSLTELTQIAVTPTSHVFKVERAAGPAVVKILTPYGAEEIHGADLMTWYGGRGAARVYDIHAEMILMEWLDGSSLGDLVRAGGDDKATEILCELMLALHEPRAAPYGQWETLSHRFETLFAIEAASWPAAHRVHFQRAMAIARSLIETTTNVVPLHGDFHHDNIVNSGRGWLTIDAKGLLGDPTYEFSNAFRNPLGASEVIVRPERIDHMATRFAAALRCDKSRVLSWAVAHSALSACWDRLAGNSIDWDLTMLPNLLLALDRTRGQTISA
jgi:streptomycin 6-kinase